LPQCILVGPAPDCLDSPELLLLFGHDGPTTFPPSEGHLSRGLQVPSRLPRGHTRATKAVTSSGVTCAPAPVGLPSTGPGIRGSAPGKRRPRVSPGTGTARLPGAPPQAATARLLGGVPETGAQAPHAALQASTAGSAP